MIKKLLALTAMSAFLSGCFSSSTSDLEKFVEDTKARMPKKLEPLPMIPEVMRLAYDPARRRNPFDPIPDRTLVLGGIQAGPTPDQDRAREYLEQFPLDTMRMVGVLEQQGTRWGLIRAQDGAIHRVSKGAYMGQNHGHITDVKLDEIVLTELKTTVLVKNGETVVLGGVFEKEESRLQGRIPFFGDLPYVGFMFQNEYIVDETNELLIFITPKILSDTVAFR